MLKVLGTIGAMAVAAALYEKARSERPTLLETVAAEELRKVLLYAAPPTFLAPVSSTESNSPLHWLDRASGN
jgi:hypothetical protein